MFGTKGETGEAHFYQLLTCRLDPARRFVDELRGSGFTVWQDVSDIRGGANWLDTIHRGIDEAAVVIILWSANSAKSDWVKDEIQWARVQKKQIIPIKLDDVPAYR